MRGSGDSRRAVMALWVLKILGFFNFYDGGSLYRADFTRLLRYVLHRIARGQLDPALIHSHHRPSGHHIHPKEAIQLSWDGIQLIRQHEPPLDPASQMSSSFGPSGTSSLVIQGMDRDILIPDKEESGSAKEEEAP